ELHHGRSRSRARHRLRRNREAPREAEAHRAHRAPRHARLFARAARREARHPRGALVHDLLRERPRPEGEPARRRRPRLQDRDGGRIGLAAQAIGIARAGYEKSIAYAKERKAFHKPIAELQAIQFMLADMAIEIDAARLLTLRAALLKDKGVRHSAESAMAKLF